MEIKEAAPKYYPKMSPSNFLEWERQQEYKHEYADGEIIAMAGASVNHNKISANIIGRTWNHLQGKECNVYPGDLRIAVKSRNSFFYPDVTIVCDEPESDEDSIKDTVKNPSVIFEILSPSTEDYDIGKKLFFYMQIQSLQQYIIIDSRKIHVRVTKKIEDGTWKFSELTERASVFFIDQINLELSLENIYDELRL